MHNITGELTTCPACCNRDGQNMNDAQDCLGWKASSFWKGSGYVDEYAQLHGVGKCSDKTYGMGAGAARRNAVATEPSIPRALGTHSLTGADLLPSLSHTLALLCTTGRFSYHPLIHREAYGKTREVQRRLNYSPRSLHNTLQTLLSSTPDRTQRIDVSLFKKIFQ